MHVPDFLAGLAWGGWRVIDVRVLGRAADGRFDVQEAFAQAQLSREPEDIAGAG